MSGAQTFSTMGQKKDLGITEIITTILIGYLHLLMISLKCMHSKVGSGIFVTNAVDMDDGCVLIQMILIVLPQPEIILLTDLPNAAQEIRHLIMTTDSVSITAHISTIIIGVDLIQHPDHDHQFNRDLVPHPQDMSESQSLLTFDHPHQKAHRPSSLSLILSLTSLMVSVDPAGIIYEVQCTASVFSFGFLFMSLFYVS
jgi:hypothetical protein